MLKGDVEVAYEGVRGGVACKLFSLRIQPLLVATSILMVFSLFLIYM